LIWRWTAHDKFTVYFLYLWLEYGGVNNTEYNIFWSLNIPLKIKIFVWFVKRNKILTKINLAKKGWIEFVTCMFCDSDEDTIYLFVSCLMITKI
jgi:zinc-binding in reverse transcriptase